MWWRIKTLGIVSLILLTPFQVSYAAILINEVAWMGTPVSSNDEWIELYNDGQDSVDLAGWELADGISFSVVLEGTISGGSFYLLERTDDQSVPDEVADQIYSGALSNDGRTISLYRNDGTLEDRIVGGENWTSLGGDNDTKDTAQLTQSGWVTGIPTPKAVNTSVLSIAPESNDEVPDDSGKKETAKTTSGSGQNAKISLQPSGRVLVLDAGEERVLYVNQNTTFEAVPSGMPEKSSHSLRYEWNFGDGNTAKGKSVRHSFTFPGTYVVVVYAEHGTYHDEDRLVVTVLPTSIELALGKEGQLFIHNNGSQEIDLSGYVVRDWQKDFIVPERTIVLPHSTLTLSPSIFKEQLFTWAITLLDSERNNIAILNGPGSVSVREESISVSVQSEQEQNIAVGKRTVPDVMEVGGNGPEETSSTVIFDSQRSATLEAIPSVNSDRLAFAGLIGVIGIGLLVLYTRRLS